MYQAIVLGHGERFQADSLKELVKALSRERIEISEGELLKNKKCIDDGRLVVVLATRKLSPNELIKKSMRPLYLGNPFRRVPDTESVRLRVTYVERNS